MLFEARLWSLALPPTLLLMAGCFISDEKHKRRLDPDGDGVLWPNDCDSTNAEIGGSEVPYDGLDNDCNPRSPDDDLDGDGLPIASDCDDLDPTMGGDEVCDGRDNDCDGKIDEGTPAIGDTFYADNDGDGFGDSDASVFACAAPEGTRTIAGDCDDADPDVNPDATEVCDARDNDCDGLTDEGPPVDATPYFVDDDGDGFGDAAVTTFACALTPGLSEDDTDCDDGDATTFPGAADVCYDGGDADCAGDSDFDCDGDGYDNEDFGYGDDCDDGDSTVHPAAIEVRDAADNNCDGLCDEGLLSYGDLVITEFMQDPKTLKDTEAEWFELYNASGADILICGGWSFYDNGSDSHTLTGEVLIAAGDHALFLRNADTGKNGGLTGDYIYGSAINLDNSDDELYVEFDGLIIDELEYDSTREDWSSAMAQGFSMQLNASLYGALENDDSLNWARGTSSYEKDNRGSPAALNDAF